MFLISTRFNEYQSYLPNKIQYFLTDEERNNLHGSNNRNIKETRNLMHLNNFSALDWRISMPHGGISERNIFFVHTQIGIIFLQLFLYVM